MVRQATNSEEKLWLLCLRHLSTAAVLWLLSIAYSGEVLLIAASSASAATRSSNQLEHPSLLVEEMVPVQAGAHQTVIDRDMAAVYMLLLPLLWRTLPIYCFRCISDDLLTYCC